jgi:hypothetical protein
MVTDTIKMAKVTAIAGTGILGTSGISKIATDIGLGVVGVGSDLYTLVASLGPWGYAGLFAAGAFGVYGLYNAIRKRNSYAQINSIDDGDDIKQIEEELENDLMSINSIFALESDRRLILGNDINKSDEYLDIKALAISLKISLLDKIKNKNNNGLVEEFITKLGELRSYTKKEISDRNSTILVINKEINDKKQGISDLVSKLGEIKNKWGLLLNEEIIDINIFEKKSIRDFKDYEGDIKTRKDLDEEIIKNQDLISNLHKRLQELNSINKREIEAIREINFYLKEIG